MQETHAKDKSLLRLRRVNLSLVQMFKTIFNSIRPDLKSGFAARVQLPKLGEQDITAAGADGSFNNQMAFQTRTISVDKCPFPITDIWGNEIAYLPEYQGMGTLSKKRSALSTSFQITRDSFMEIKHLADEVGAELVLLYIPTKLHVHLDGITDECSTVPATIYWHLRMIRN